MDCNLPGFSVHGDSPGRILEWVAMSSSRGSSQPRDQIQVSRIAADSLPSEPPGKPKNTGVGSVSLLQGIFLTQGLNRDLLHCRLILYQLSYQGRPSSLILGFQRLNIWKKWGIWTTIAFRHEGSKTQWGVIIA